MALVNHAKKEINAKIVYFGPAHGGKGAALTYIYSRIKPSLRGELKSVPAGSDNLLLFDFSPFETPLPNGYRLRLHVYTLTGIVTNPATWKMTLKGTDGIMIMIDPGAEHAAEASESISQLRDFLSAYGVGLHETPAVLQFSTSSREMLPDEEAQIASSLDLATLSTCCSNTVSGEGLLEALTTLSRQILDRVTLCDELSQADSASTAPPSKIEAPQPPEPDVSPPGTSYAGNAATVALQTHEITADGGTIRIPVVLTQGDTLRKLVVTVNIDFE